MGSCGPVAIDATPRSEVACNSLVQTDNKLFNKVIIVFSYLCDEATALRDRARDHLLPALLLLADQPAMASAAVEAGVAAAALAEPPRPEVAANAALPLLLAVQQFSIRVNALAVNLIRQLASLYSPQQKLFAATFRAVTMRRAFDALGDLLGVLILLDDALQFEESGGGGSGANGGTGGEGSGAERFSHLGTLLEQEATYTELLVGRVLALRYVARRTAPAGWAWAATAARSIHCANEEKLRPAREAIQRSQA